MQCYFIWHSLTYTYYLTFNHFSNIILWSTNNTVPRFPFDISHVLRQISIRKTIFFLFNWSLFQSHRYNSTSIGSDQYICMHLATYTAFRVYIFFSMCVPWELNPQPFVLLTQCSTTEPLEQTILYGHQVSLTGWHPGHTQATIDSSESNPMWVLVSSRSAS